jgi:hypothetical protein
MSSGAFCAIEKYQQEPFVHCEFTFGAPWYQQGSPQLLLPVTSRSLAVGRSLANLHQEPFVNWEFTFGAPWCHHGSPLLLLQLSSRALDSRWLPRVFTSGAICPLRIYIRSLFISVNLHQEPFAH